MRPLWRSYFFEGNLIQPVSIIFSILFKHYNKILTSQIDRNALFLVSLCNRFPTILFILTFIATGSYT